MIRPGDRVRLAPAVIARIEGRFRAARGTVLAVEGRVARVDWHGSFIPHEDGGTVRSMPTANLRRVRGLSSTVARPAGATGPQQGPEGDVTGVTGRYTGGCNAPGFAKCLILQGISVTLQMLHKK